MLDEYLISSAQVPDRNADHIHSALNPVQVVRQRERIREVFRLQNGEIPHFNLVYPGVGPN
jgi:hypothetical protein